jgi:excisionase family DNA binding protein
METERLYTLAEVSRIFGVNLSTLYLWRKRGRIKSMTLGGQNKVVRIKASEVERFLQAGGIPVNERESYMKLADQKG